VKSFYRVELEITPRDSFDITHLLGLLSSALQKTEGILGSKVNRIQEVFEDGYLFQNRDSLP